MMCFHGSLSELVYLHVPTFETQQLHQSSLLPPLISHHPTLCSLTARLHLSFHPLSCSCPSSSFCPSPTAPRIPLSPPIPLLHLPSLAVSYISVLVTGQSSTRLFFLLLLVSCILRLSRRLAKTLLSPSHHPIMNSSFISFLFLSSSAVLSPCEFDLFIFYNFMGFCTIYRLIKVILLTEPFHFLSHYNYIP